MRDNFDVPLRRENQRGYSLSEWIDTAKPFVGEQTLIRAKERFWNALKRDNLFFLKMEPLDGARRAVNELVGVCNMVAITSRQVWVRKSTAIALARDFPAIHTLGEGQKLPWLIMTSNKARAAKALGCNYFFEDCAKTVGQILRKKVTVFHIDRFGESIVGPGTRRLHQISSVGEGVEKIIAWSAHRPGGISHEQATL